MTKTPVCPLCSNSDGTRVETIRTVDLDRLYEKEAGVSIQKMFHQVDSIDLMKCGQCDLQYFYPLIPGTQEFYEGLQKFDWYYFNDKPEFDLAVQYIKAEDKVLEIGAGKGAFAKKIPSNEYIGLEFSDQAIKFAKANGVRLLASSIQDYSTSNKAEHDIVCNFQVLEHVSDVKEFLSSSVDCLKPGGRMIISVPSIDSFSKYVSNFWTDMPPHHLTRWSDRALTSIAENFGLELLDIHHEKLQLVHKEFYAATVFSRSLSGIFGRPFLNLDLSLSARLINRLANLLGGLFSRGLVSDVLLPRGISVVAVFRKPDAK